MRYLSNKPAFLIIVVLSTASYFHRANSSAGVKAAQSPLTGAAAVAHLKEEGLYSSLAEAVRAAHDNARPLSAAKSPLTIDPPTVQLSRLTAGDGAANDWFGWSVAVSGETVVVGAVVDDIGANRDQGSAYVFVRSGGVWSFQQKLTANDGAARGRFGSSVAISGDTIVIGAPHDSTATNSDRDAAYLFVRSGTVWSFQQKLTPDNDPINIGFGNAVAIDGDVVIIGAPHDGTTTDSNRGAAYVFARSGSVWSFQQKLAASDGTAGDQFGNSVAVSGDTVLIGAFLDNIGANIGQGSAYVFVRSGTVWSFQQKLTANDGAEDDEFGKAVAINGNTVLIGACRNTINGNDKQGAAYIFVRSESEWSFQQKLTANDGAAVDLFGISVALHGNTALVGAHIDDIGAVENQGSAYLFSRSGTSWTQRQKLAAQDGMAGDNFGAAVALNGDTAIAGAPIAKVGANAEQGALYLFGCGYIEQQAFTGAGGAEGDNFGAAVAIDGDTAVVGSPFDDVGTASDQGSAFVFVRSGAAWTQTAQLFANDGAARDEFGTSVAISGDYIIIGAFRKSINGNLFQGAAYVFVRGGGTWTQQARLLAGDGAAGDHFGFSVSISGSRVAVGEILDDIGGKQNQGSVHLFTRAGSVWTPEIKLTANDGATEDYFGWSVAIAGDLVIAGAPYADIGAKRDQGAAYVFENLVTPWRQRVKFVADDGAAFDSFGYSVALSGNTALVGAPSKSFDSNVLQGTAYIFVGPSNPVDTWSLQGRLRLGNDADDDHLGISVALSGNTAVVGARRKSISGRDSQGAAFVFTRAGTVWSPRQPIVASDGAAGAHFGSSSAISGDTIVVGATLGGSSRHGAAYVFKNDCGPPLTPIASVSAASFAAGGQLAPESITAGFGSTLGDDTLAASSLPLPTTLGGLSLKVTDSAGDERLAPLFFVSPGQINYQIPPGTVNGPVTVMVTNGAGPVASGTAIVANVAPGLFSANSSGQGVAAAVALRVKADGSQSFEPVAQFDSAQNRYVPVPIDLGPDLGNASDQVFLVLYGTGLKFRSSLSAVSCTIGGIDNAALYAGAAPGFAGLDQVNVPLQRALAGRGEVDVVLLVDGKAANTVRVSIR
jgi:uncharacterized protein (TIGR03437 family)